jgi:cytochrome c biogenesis protein CcdA
MKLFRTKIWNWRDVLMLKWGAFLFGIAAGAYFHGCVMPYLWIIIVVAALLIIRPAIAYFKD